MNSSTAVASGAVRLKISAHRFLFSFMWTILYPAILWTGLYLLYKSQTPLTHRLTDQEISGTTTERIAMTRCTQLHLSSRSRRSIRKVSTNSIGCMILTQIYIHDRIICKIKLWFQTIYQFDNFYKITYIF